jgi:hypothetical protein
VQSGGGAREELLQTIKCKRCRWTADKTAHIALLDSPVQAVDKESGVGSDEKRCGQGAWQQRACSGKGARRLLAIHSQFVVFFGSNVRPGDRVSPKNPSTPLASRMRHRPKRLSGEVPSYSKLDQEPTRGTNSLRMLALASDRPARVRAANHAARRPISGG